MTLPLIIYRSLRQHALATLVSAASIALATGLLTTIWTLRAQTRRATIADFHDKTNWLDHILALITIIVALVATASVLASIYASMSARQRDIAILRALGAKRSTIFGAVVLEALAIGALGAACGFLVHAMLMGLASAIIHAQTGVLIPMFECGRILLWTPLGMMTLAALGGLVPAMKAYRVPVAQTLSPLS